MNIKREAEKIRAHMEKMRHDAEAKFLGWRKEKPDRQGVWFGAKWQISGFYHVLRYPGEATLKYLCEKNDEFWSGPYSEETSKEEWMRFLPRPNHPPKVLRICS